MSGKLLSAIQRSEEFCRGYEAKYKDNPAAQEMAAQLKIVIAAAKTVAAKKRKPGEPRPRNIHLDVLATICGFKLTEVPPAMWGRLSKALKEIQTVMPEVTPEEISRRAGIYKQQWPERDLTGTALAAWWAKCGTLPRANNSSSVRMGENLLK